MKISEMKNLWVAAKRDNKKNKILVIANGEERAVADAYSFFYADLIRRNAKNWREALYGSGEEDDMPPLDSIVTRRFTEADLVEDFDCERILAPAGGPCG